MIFDVHCHLSFEQFDKDRDNVVKKALDNDVYMINASVSPEEIPKAREVYEKYENVYWTLGLSASEIDEKKVDETIKAVKENKDKIIGIGEVGLDYYWVKDPEDRKKEKVNFTRFIELSKELDLPLIIHSRDAEEECIEMLDEYKMNALMHCFSGSIEQAEKAVSLGCLISIPTNISYSKQKQKLAKQLPLESIVLETDAPYLSPVPKTRNEPVNVGKSLEKISELRDIDSSTIEETTSRNARKFFKL